MLLAKVLMAQADAAAAAAKLAQIEPQGYKLMPDFSDNFRLAKEDNEELLFEFQWRQTAV